MNKILVWDWPVRIGHWLLVGGFILAWLISDGEAFRLVHAVAGGTVVGVVLFRLLWGALGTRHARFATFVRGPDAVFDYLKRLLSSQPIHTAGHNPAGGWAIIALLALALLTGATGWLAYQDMGAEWLEEAHEIFANGMIFVVAVHLAGVLVGSLAHRENLVWAMFSGRKEGAADEAIGSARLWAVPLLLASAAACGWWLAR